MIGMSGLGWISTWIVVAIRSTAANGAGDGGIYEAVPSLRVSGPFDSESEGGTTQGYTIGGIGWYRECFALPAEWKGRRTAELSLRAREVRAGR